MDAVADRQAITSAQAWAAVGRGREAAAVDESSALTPGFPQQDEAAGAEVSSQPEGNTRPAQQPAATTQPGLKELTDQQLQQLRDLQQRDREVRQHEQAHLAAAGGLAMSGATYTMERGPDGQSYAVGGEVQISMSAGRTPEETIRRAEIIMAAATAPAEPSGQDRAVAAQARQMHAQATAEQLAAQMDASGAARGAARGEAAPATTDAAINAETAPIPATAGAAASPAPAPALAATGIEQAHQATAQAAVEAIEAATTADSSVGLSAMPAVKPLAAGVATGSDEAGLATSVKPADAAAFSPGAVGQGVDETARAAGQFAMRTPHPGAQSTADGLSMYRQLAREAETASSGVSSQAAPSDTASRLIRTAA